MAANQTDRDQELFAEILRLKSQGADFRPLLGELCERWRQPAYLVVRRIQASFLRGSPEDESDLFHDAVGKFLSRGLDTFHGISEQAPERAASPKTFFLRIVKHAAIDRYRRQREEPIVSAEDSDDDREESSAEAAQAIVASRRTSEKKESSEIYWRAFKRLKAEHPNEATAWDLYHHQDVEDHEACARQLQISVANSYKRVSRAQAYLKLYLLEMLSEAEEQQ